MTIRLHVDEAEQLLESYLRTLRGASSMAITVQIDKPEAPSAPVKPIISDTSILDKIAAGKRGDKIALIQELRQFASEQGVTFGLAFAKKLVELAPQFRNEYTLYPPVSEISLPEDYKDKSTL